MRRIRCQARQVDTESTRDAMQTPCNSSCTPALAACLLILAATSLLSAGAARAQDEVGGLAASGPALSELFRLGDESRGDSILFGSIEGLIAVGRSGRILVGERQNSRVYSFTADGRYIQAIGRHGDGPGEFQSIMSVRVGPGDTLYVFDSWRERLSAFEPDDLDLAYSVAVFRDSLGAPFELLGLGESGFLLTYRWLATPANIMQERRAYALRVDWTGAVLPPPAHELPDVQFFLDPASKFTVEVPFGRRPIYRLGPGGDLYAGWTESVDIAVTAPDGSPGGTISYAYAIDPIPLTREELELFVERNLGRSSDGHRKRVLGADAPATKPAFETFVVDDRARIWLKTTPPSIADTSAVWLVLDAESRLYGKVELPASTNLHVIQGDRAYAVTEDAETAVIVYQFSE